MGETIAPGTQIERWYVEKKLGEGGFGAVYKVRDQTGQYALKVESVDEKVQASFFYPFITELYGNRLECADGKIQAGLSGKWRTSTFP
ncbi:hypothetical protein GCK32_020587, partial [Trichostrongylus colubriformis]